LLLQLSNIADLLISATRRNAGSREIGAEVPREESLVLFLHFSACKLSR
jgi:hypothetical protein